jgi:putative tryptophan/tyrosine transport system substrate-binding protein
MRRRDLIKLIAISAAVWPLAARAQQTDRVYRIGLLRIGPPPPSFIEPLRHGLSELGHVEGKSFVFDLGIAEDVEQLTNLAAELIRREVDVILASGTPAVLPARNATSTVHPSSSSLPSIRSRREWSQAWRDRAATSPD